MEVCGQLKKACCNSFSAPDNEYIWIDVKKFPCLSIT